MAYQNHCPARSARGLANRVGVEPVKVKEASIIFISSDNNLQASSSPINASENLIAAPERLLQI